MTTLLAPSARSINHEAFVWFACNTLPRKETLAEYLLGQKGLETFCPRRAQYRHRNKADKARRSKVVRYYPQIPSLIFVGFPIAARVIEWQHVTECPMISRIISSNPTHPIPIAPASIGELIRCYDEGRWVAPEHQRHMTTNAEFDVGDKVRMIDGALQDADLRVEEIRGNTARVMGEMFGASRGFDVEVERLVKADG